MLEVGQKVKVIDQRPPAVGIVEEVSTWRVVLGEPNNDDTCYYIYCDEWRGTGRWLGACFVEAV
jgi:hypothetical protein